MAHQRTPLLVAKACKPIFRKCVFVLSGNFVTANGKDKTVANITRWLTTWGGKIQKDVTDDTTHLICTMENYENKVPAVRKALTLDKRCKILTWDFIEECLCQKPEMYRVTAERFWQVEKALKRDRQAQKEKRRHKERCLKDMESWHGMADPKLWHVHLDPTFFLMKVVLTRVSENIDQDLTETYTLYLFESNAKPHLFKVGAKFRRGNRAKGVHLFSEKEYCGAFAEFKRLFRNKTKVEWDKRCDGIVISEDKEAFRYFPPTGGKSVGMLPAGWMAPANLQPNLPLEPEFGQAKDNKTVVNQNLQPDLGRRVYEAYNTALEEKSPEEGDSNPEDKELGEDKMEEDELNYNELGESDLHLIEISRLSPTLTDGD